MTRATVQRSSHGLDSIGRRWRRGCRAGRPGGPGGRRRRRRRRRRGRATTASGTDGQRRSARSPPGRRAPDQAPAEEHAEAEAADRAEDGDDHRLPPHRRPQLGAGLADRPEQAELTGALVDRQRQRVGDAHQGDQRRPGRAGRRRGRASGRSRTPTRVDVLVARLRRRVRRSGSVTACDRGLALGFRTTPSARSIEHDDVAGLRGVRRPVGRRS